MCTQLWMSPSSSHASCRHTVGLGAVAQARKRSLHSRQYAAKSRHNVNSERWYRAQGLVGVLQTGEHKALAQRAVELWEEGR